MTLSRRCLTPLLLLAALSDDALAVRFRRPFAPDRGITASFDNDRRSGVMRDYGCGQNTYENHTGTDFRIAFSDVYAMAPARVVSTFNGCANYGSLGNQCGGRCGNSVKLQFEDGAVALYCHLQLNSIVVSPGQRVSCGQKLGVSASSGSSTGPHLHVSWWVGGVLRDLYAGSCSNSGGAWTQQRGYLQAPGTDCQVTCDCSPGTVQQQGCGRCGVRSRQCGGDCQWGGWSACQSEGPCSPGQRQMEACCDCGRRTRVCNSACRWEGFGDCAGEDPPGAPRCDTGQPGVCADGRQRCVGGCLSCVRLQAPSPELCDGLDNDCDGPVDEGRPQQLGTPPPRHAAQVTDLALPRWLAEGSRAEAWIAFRNVGTETWRPGELFLRADATAEGRASRLMPETGWRAFDVPAVVEEAVPPGSTVVLRFPVAGRPSTLAESLAIDESFSLVAPTGQAVACPEGGITLAVAVAPSSDESSGSARGVHIEAASSPSTAEGCASTPATPFALLLLLRRRRARPRRPE